MQRIHASRLRDRRHELGFSQVELAVIAGLSLPVVNTTERMGLATERTTRALEAALQLERGALACPGDRP